MDRKTLPHSVLNAVKVLTKYINNNGGIHAEISYLGMLRLYDATDRWITYTPISQDAMLMDILTGVTSSDITNDCAQQL